MNEMTYSVAQLNYYIKNTIEAEVMLENVLVLGEISSYSVTRGIAYFNIKDESGMLACVLFSAERYGNVKIGDMVLLRGSVKYYAKGGKISFNAVSLEQYGKGALYQQFLLLKEQLENKGYFDNDKKLPIPTHIKRIGVITSKTGAVLQDIKNVAYRRNPSIDLVLYDVSVQGNFAKNQIINAINFFSNYEKIDVIIVARGGGSIEDLQPFNECEVAEAVYNCKKPLISAVGHETDFTIIDFVSDLRAPTPSAAAEILTTDVMQLRKHLKSQQLSMTENLNKQLNVISQSLSYKVNLIKNKLDNNILYNENKLEKNKIKLNNMVDNQINENIYKLGLLINSIERLNPINILKKGYARVVKDNKGVVSVNDITVGDTVDINILDGKILAEVKGVQK